MNLPNKPYELQASASELNITISNNLEAETLVFTMPNKYGGVRTDIALAEIITDLSRSKLTNWLKEGHILIDQQLAKPKVKINGGETVTITPPFDAESSAYLPENIPLSIVYSDEHLIVINKPAGLTVHPGNGNWQGTLLNGLLYHFPELSHIPRAGIVHRLDKNTTGLMVVARTLLAHTNLVQQLQQRSVSRIYRAIVEGYPFKQGIITKNIGRDPHNRIKMTTLEHGGREAITHYRVLQQFDKLCHIECQLKTGRTHQIRVHLKDRGHPLIGDPLYGRGKINYAPEINLAIDNLHRQALHAIKLSFLHPLTQQPVTFKIRLAEDMRNLLQALNYVAGGGEDFDDYSEADDENWEIIYAPE